MTEISANSASADEYWARMYEMSNDAQHPNREHRRSERHRILGMAGSNARFGAMLAVEQERLTVTLMDAISVAQEKGWVRADLDPRAIAVFLQAYTLGRTVDDVAENHLDPEAWTALIKVVTGPLSA